MSWRRSLAPTTRETTPGHRRRQRQHVGMVLFPTTVVHVDAQVQVGLVLFSLMAAVAGRGGAKAIGANSRIRPEHEEWWRTPMAGCGWTWLRDVRDRMGNENRGGPAWKTILTTVFW